MIVLDTHVLVWWATGNNALSNKARAIIQSQQSCGGTVGVSCISAWEIAMLVRQGKLVLSTDVDAWLAAVRQIKSLKFIPVDVDIAVGSVVLPGQFHKDPADRMIVATARGLSAPLVTKDAKIRAYPHVRTIW